MKITRSRRLTFNPVSYETVEVFAQIEFEPGEIDDNPEGWDTDYWANVRLNELLAEEIEEVAKVTTNRKSIINDYRFTDTQ